MDSGGMLKLSVCFLAAIALAHCTPEVHTFRVSWGGESVNGVVETDVNGNWISHHVFPSNNISGVTIARDHNLGVEVFVHDKQKDVCYTRPIEKGTQSPLAIQSELQLLDEHHRKLEVSQKAQEEYLECTGELVDPKTLGRVAYLCRDKPVYTLRKIPRVKREAQEFADGCYICGWSKCRRRRRDLLPMVGCAHTMRMVYIKSC